MQVYSAQKEILNSIDFSKSAPLSVDYFEWKDPMRQFDEMGRDIPSQLRHWLTLSVEDRASFLERYRLERKRESEAEWQSKLDKRWRDLSFIIQEELRAFTRPELSGKGNRSIIATAVNLIVPKEVPAPVPQKR